MNIVLELMNLKNLSRILHLMYKLLFGSVKFILGVVLD